MVEEELALLCDLLLNIGTLSKTEMKRCHIEYPQGAYIDFTRSCERYMREVP